MFLNRTSWLCHVVSVTRACCSTGADDAFGGPSGPDPGQDLGSQAGDREGEAGVAVPTPYCQHV